MKKLFSPLRAVFVATLLSLATAAPVSAHEVYVLSSASSSKALKSAGFSEWQVILANLHQFAFWALIVSTVFFVIFFTSISRRFERFADPFLRKLPPYAPVVSRITVGLGFLSAAYHGALFGPELPLTDAFGSYADIASVALVFVGLMLVFGLYARMAALIALGLFAIEAAAHGFYLLTYANYFGEIILLLILGAHAVGVHTKRRDDARLPRRLLALKNALTPYAFPFLRVTFGISLLYASLYAKIIHNDLALMVASTPLAGHTTSLAQAFGFEPHFLVLGAAIIEILLALLFILGIEIRFASIFLLFWLSLSLWYFGEAVWPHIVLIGIPIAFILYGYDKYGLEGRFFKRGGREPVL